MWAAALYVAGLLGLTTLLTHVYFRRKDPASYRGKHVVVTGGSEGIGLELARKFRSWGARVTLVARTEGKLQRAVEELRSDGGPEDAVQYVAADVTDFAKVRTALKKAEELQAGTPIHTVIMCAGLALPGYFLDQDVQVFEKSMQVNYMGSLYCAKASAEMMVASKTRGSLVFVSSPASCAAFTGYSSYSPTKAAVRGLADALRNELRGFGIQVFISYPPDTETPGFDKENETKPKETKEISPPEAHSASSVAEQMLDSLLRGEYHMRSPDLVQNLMISMVTCITPRGRWAPLEIAFAPILAIAMLLFKIHADNVSSGYGKRVLAGGKSE